MARYLFQAQYRGAMLTDDIGEEFPTLHEAETHATVVANELGRNSTQDQAVTYLCSARMENCSRAAPRSADECLIIARYRHGPIC
ncbi:MAG: hypothetical protein WAR76_00790 [Xanthobacteraceae bacterium]